VAGKKKNLNARRPVSRLDPRHGREGPSAPAAHVAPRRPIAGRHVCQVADMPLLAPRGQCAAGCGDGTKKVVTHTASATYELAGWRDASHALLPLEDELTDVRFNKTYEWRDAQEKQVQSHF